MTLTHAEIERTIALARHDREDVRVRALDVLRDERVARSHDYTALSALVEQVWLRDPFVALAMGQGDGVNDCA